MDSCGRLGRIPATATEKPAWWGSIAGDEASPEKRDFAFPGTKLKAGYTKTEDRAANSPRTLVRAVTT